MAKLPRSSLGRRGIPFPPLKGEKGMVRLAGTRAVAPNLCFGALLLVVCRDNRPRAAIDDIPVFA
jgi:hypothetical protein